MANPNTSPFSALSIMGMFSLGAIIAILIFGFYLKTEPFKYDEVHIMNNHDEIADLLKPLQEEKTDSLKTQPQQKGQTADNNGVKDEAIKALQLNAIQDLYFNYHTKFIAWIMMFVILVGLSFGVILPTWRQLKNIHLAFMHEAVVYRKSVFWAAVFLGAAVLIAGGAPISWLSKQGDLRMSFIPIMTKFEIMLSNPKVALRSLIGLGCLGPLLALVGIFVVNWSVSALKVDEGISKVTEKFRILVNSLDFFLMVSAVIITWTTVTTALGREAIIQALPIDTSIILPIEFVYLYGLVFTLILGVVYIPVYLILKSTGKQLHNHFAKQTTPTETNEEQTQKPLELNQLEVNTLLMQTSAIESFKVSLSILGPLLTSLLSKLVEV